MDANYQGNLSEKPAPAIRRVGTFTLGISFILLGVIISAALYFGEVWWKLLLFSPLVLICLGAEILYYSFRYKDVKYKYDGLSVFFILFITLGVMICSGVSKAATSAASYSKMIEDARISAIKTAQKAVADNNCAANVNGNLSTSASQIIAAMLNNDRDFKCPVTVGIEFITVNGTKTPDKEQICKTLQCRVRLRPPNLSSLSLCFIVTNGIPRGIKRQRNSQRQSAGYKNRIHSYKNITHNGSALCPHCWFCLYSRLLSGFKRTGGYDNPPVRLHNSKIHAVAEFCWSYLPLNAHTFSSFLTSAVSHSAICPAFSKSAPVEVIYALILGSVPDGRTIKPAFPSSRKDSTLDFGR